MGALLAGIAQGLGTPGLGTQIGQNMAAAQQMQQRQALAQQQAAEQERLNQYRTQTAGLAANPNATMQDIAKLQASYNPDAANKTMATNIQQKQKKIQDQIDAGLGMLKLAIQYKNQGLVDNTVKFLKENYSDNPLVNSFDNLKIASDGESFDIDYVKDLKEGDPLLEKYGVPDGKYILTRNSKTNQITGIKNYKTTGLSPEEWNRRFEKEKEEWNVRYEKGKNKQEQAEFRKAIRSASYGKAMDGLSSVEKALSIFESNPKVTNMFNQLVLQKLGIGDSGEFKTSLDNATDLITRIRTGAALNNQEIAFYKTVFTPQWYNDTENQKNKLLLLREIFGEARNRILDPTREKVRLQDIGSKYGYKIEDYNKNEDKIILVNPNATNNQQQSNSQPTITPPTAEELAEYRKLKGL